MLDLIVLALGIGLFALSIGYARWEAARDNSTTTHDVIAGVPVAAAAS